MQRGLAWDVRFALHPVPRFDVWVYGSRNVIVLMNLVYDFNVDHNRW
jgi:hypothetical protein